MKKTLVALAALAATASFAQSTVSIDGILDAGYQSINYKGNSVSDIGSNGSSTSQINFRGSEDLGGGMKAEFRFETDINMVSNLGNQGAPSLISLGSQTGTGPTAPTTLVPTKGQVNSTSSTFGNGEIRLGVSGAFGRVDLGSPNLNSLTTYGTGQPYGTAIGGGFRGVYVTDTSATSVVRFDNAIKYATPSMNGFVGTLYYVNKNTNAKTSDPLATSTTALQSSAYAFSSTIGAYDHFGATELGLNYSNGPLNVSYSVNNQDYDGVTVATNAAQAFTTSVRTLGANYTMGALTGYFLQQQQSGSNAAVDKNFASVALGYTMGNNVFTVLYGSGTKNASTKTTTMASAGYDYNLSKRTAVYVRYESITDDAALITAVATVDGSDTVRTRAAIGLRHNF